MVHKFIHKSLVSLYHLSDINTCIFPLLYAVYSFAAQILLNRAHFRAFFEPQIKGI